MFAGKQASRVQPLLNLRTSAPAHYILSFLASLANGDTPAGEIESLLRTIAPAHWEYLLTDAVRHHLHPLIFKNLKKNNLLHHIPHDVRVKIERNVVETTAYTSFLLEMGHRIMNAAEAKNLLLVPLKGMHFISHYYSPEERPMRDVDFLIRRNDVALVEELMEALGFQVFTGNLSLMFLKHFGGELKFKTKNGEMPAVVETQWNIAEAPYLKRAFAFDPEWLIESVEGNRRLSPEAALVFSIFHLAVSHFFSRLIWLLDIHKIISVGSLQWEKVLEIVEIFKMKKAFQITIDLCREFFGTSVPDEISAPFLCSHPIIRKIVLESLSGRGRHPESGIITLLICEHPIAFLFSFLFPGVEFVSLRYSLPPWKAFFYSLIRPFKLIFPNRTTATI